VVPVGLGDGLVGVGLGLVVVGVGVGLVVVGVGVGLVVVGVGVGEVLEGLGDGPAPAMGSGMAVAPLLGAVPRPKWPYIPASRLYWL